MSPLSNAYLTAAQLNQMEAFYPLCARVCTQCFLVQLEPVAGPEELFGDYAYFSSYSASWLKHAQAYATGMIERFHFDAQSLVAEVASNDGYLLQYFQERGIPVLGIEPARNVARAAEDKGIPTLAKFFGKELASELAASGRQAELIVGNNVLAHVPDLDDFVAALELLLKPGGVCTLEFPHLLRLIEDNQFDTIYHEHLSYFSFATAEEILLRHRLTVFDVEEIPTHGGSLRVFAGHAGENARTPSLRASQLKRREIEAGLRRPETYAGFGEKVRECKRALLERLTALKRAGKSVVAYGAPAKGNTLLNYCGVGRDFLDYTVDLSPHKQGHFLPGTHLPIYAPERIRQTHPDYVLILPWNLRDEIMSQLGEIRQWGGRFIVPIPQPVVIS
jgi:2-polyprenyl-3-methyl-5-hydroxy-6-metoxy-1,4-benzoquinol methylase